MAPALAGDSSCYDPFIDSPIKEPYLQSYRGLACHILSRPGVPQLACHLTIWRQLIVDTARASVVRQKTVATQSWLQELSQQLQELDPTHWWWNPASDQQAIDRRGSHSQHHVDAAHAHPTEDILKRRSRTLMSFDQLRTLRHSSPSALALAWSASQLMGQWCNGMDGGARLGDRTKYVWIASASHPFVLRRQRRVRSAYA